MEEPIGAFNYMLHDVTLIFATRINSIGLS